MSRLQKAQLQEQEDADEKGGVPELEGISAAEAVHRRYIMWATNLNL